MYLPCVCFLSILPSFHLSSHSFYCLYRHPCIHPMAGWCFAGLHCSPRRRPGRLVVNLKHHHGNGKSSALIVDTPSIWSRRFSPNACDILHKGAVFGKPWWLLLVFGTCVLVVCFGWLNLCYIEKYDYDYKYKDVFRNWLGLSMLVALMIWPVKTGKELERCLMYKI